MDSTQLYAAAVAGLMSLMLIMNMIRQVQQRIMCLAWLGRCFARVLQWPVYFFLKHFVYSFILKRTRFFGPFSRSAFATQILYWAGTAVCNVFRVTTASAAGTRAGELAVVNFAVLLLGGKFEFLSDLLGVRVNTYRQAHQTVSIMTCLQSLIHILLNTRHGISLGDPLYLFGLLVSSSNLSIHQESHLSPGIGRHCIPSSHCSPQAVVVCGLCQSAFTPGSFHARGVMASSPGEESTQSAVPSYRKRAALLFDSDSVVPLRTTERFSVWDRM
jgi:hypothetical protein